MFKRIILTVVSLLAVASTQAATIALNKGLSAGFNVLRADGTTVMTGANGGTVFLGTFAGGIAPPAPVDNDYTTILTLFNVFGSKTIDSNSNTHVLTGSITAAPSTPNDALFEGLRMYIIVANTNSLATATEIGIFTNTTATLFPTDVQGTATANFNVTTQGAAPGLISPASGAGSVINNATGIDNLRMVAVPEPSTAAFALLSGLGLMVRRRRA